MLIEHTTIPLPAVNVPPGHNPPTTIANTRRFYMVGEAERSNRRSTAVTDGRAEISINGRWHALRGRTVTFEQLVGLAYPAAANQAGVTVMFRRGHPSAREGTLTPGDIIPMADGLLVNAIATHAS